MAHGIQAAVGRSGNGDAAQAGREAAERAVARLEGGPPHFAIVFGSSWFSQMPLLAGVRTVLKTPLIGCSTAGEIVPEGPTSHSCVIMVLSSDVMRWSVGFAKEIGHAPREAGQQAAHAALQGLRTGPRIGFLVLADGLMPQRTELMRGIQEAVGTSSLVVGGLAGDDLQFRRTYQYINQQVFSGGVVGAAMSGTAKLGFGIEHGFAPISKPRRVTRAHANVLVELDRQPAASVYEEYFGREVVSHLHERGLSRQTIAYPLGIQCEESNQWLLRSVVAFQEDGSLSCSGEIREGAWLQLMIGSKELALEASRRAAQRATHGMNHIAAALVFDSVARRTLLGPQESAAEITRIHNVIGRQVPLAGCYTYGEHAPFASLDAGHSVQTGAVLIIVMGT